MTIPIKKSLSIPQFFSKLIPKKSSAHSTIRKIGLNVGRANLVGCEVLHQDGQIILERCLKKPVAKDKALSLQLKDFIKEAGFESKQVSVSLKGQGVVIRFLSFPKMSRTDFASSIQFEAEKYLPFSLSEVILDYHISENTSSGEEAATMPVILVAVRKGEVEKLIGAVQGAGLEIDAIDVDTFTCFNAFERAHAEAKQHSFGLVDFGAADTSLIIFDKGTLTFSRDVAFGGNDIAETIRKKLNISISEATSILEAPEVTQPDHRTAIEEGLDRLFQELKLSLNYYYNQQQGSGALEAFYISGGFSRMPLLPRLFEKQVEKPVKSWDPTASLVLGKGLSAETLKPLIPYLPVSIGLAIRPR